MTVSGLRPACRTNAVSALHGEVSRAMWKGLYPDGWALRRIHHVRGIESVDDGELWETSQPETAPVAVRPPPLPPNRPRAASLPKSGPT